MTHANPVDPAERFRGCLLGGAVGDALGAAVEFMHRTDILAWFGPGGIRDYVPVDGRLGAITDDTQLTLFCAEGLLRAFTQGAWPPEQPAFGQERARAYLRWLATQGERHPTLSDPGESWLLRHQELFHRRAPGVTCLSSLLAMPGLGEPARNDSSGCGGVMRIAPVGLFCSAWYADVPDFDTWVFDAGVADAALTHGHPSGHLPAGFAALLVALLAATVPIEAALDRCLRQLAARRGNEATRSAIERALDLARRRPHDPAALASLGHGWTGEQALSMALYCVLGGGDFESSVVLAVNHDGDSDSTGAISGALIGAQQGDRVIPTRWLDTLELRTVLETVAGDLWAAPRGLDALAAGSDSLQERYRTAAAWR
jgi:ADP-ribosylglycohydrolase